MRSEYSKWFWSECDELNKDTSFAHSLAEKAWNYRQTEVDELKLQVAEMKSRLNDAYTDGQSAMYTARQSKIDELQKRVDKALKMLDQFYCEGNLDSLEKAEQALKGGGE